MYDQLRRLPVAFIVANMEVRGDLRIEHHMFFVFLPHFIRFTHICNS